MVRTTMLAESGSTRYNTFGFKGDAIRLRLLSRLWNSTMRSGASAAPGFPAYLHPLQLWSKSLEQTWTTLLLAALLISTTLFTCYWLLRLNLSEGSSKQTNTLWQLSDQLNAESSISYGEVELDSDEYEAETETEKRHCSLGGYRARAGLRRLVGRDPHALAKRNNVIRIVSSDPTSNLCENPIHVELETTRRALIASSPFTAPAANTHAAPVAETATTVRRSASNNGSPAPGRRKRDSGRFAAGTKGYAAGQGPSRSSSIDSTRSLRSKQPGDKTAASPVARQSARAQPSPTLAEAANKVKPNKRAAIHDDGWTDEVTAEDGSEAADLQGRMSPSTASIHSFVSASSGARSGWGIASNASPVPSPVSPTFSLPSRLPSILKKEPQSFRSGLLSQVDIAYSLVQRSASLGSVPGGTGPQSGVASTEPSAPASTGAAAPPPPPYSPTSPETHSTSLSWHRRPPKQIKLTEPDWSQHADTHDRARERLEAAARVKAARKRSASFDVGMLPTTQDVGVRRSRSDGGNELDLAGADDGDSEEFWFERFTQSTAAAGRDWDWRKRRARAASTATANNSTAPSSIVEAVTKGAQTQHGLGNVELDEVQLQRKQDVDGDPMKRAALLRKTPTAPLITFDPEGLPDKPILAPDTKETEVGSPRSASAGNRLRSDGTSGSLLHASSPNQRGADDEREYPLPFTSAVSVNPLDSLLCAGTGPYLKKSGSASASLKKGVVRMMRRRTSASDTIMDGDAGSQITPLLLASTSDEKLVRGKRAASYALKAHDSVDSLASWKPLGGGSSDGSQASLNVPGRFSSLTSLGRKVSLNDFKGSRSTSSPQIRIGKSASIPELHGSRAASTGVSSAVNDASAVDSASPNGTDAGNQASAYASGALPNDRDGWIVPSPVANASNIKVSSARISVKLERDSGGSPGAKNPESQPREATAFYAPTKGKKTDGLTPSDSSGSVRQKHAAPPPLLGAEPHADLRIDVSPARLMRYQKSSEEAIVSPMALSPLNRGSDASPLGVQLAPASPSSPPIAKTKVRPGSRASILKSAGGARSDLDRSSTRARRGSRTGSVASSTTGTGSLRRVSSRPKSMRDTAPVPSMQPEPAPMGMAARARSASLSSNGSRSSITSQGSRRDGLGALTSMSSAPNSRIGSGYNTPDETLFGFRDPFVMTPISPTLSDGSMSPVLSLSSSSPDLKRHGSRGRLTSRNPPSSPFGGGLPFSSVSDAGDRAERS
ncbi:hypothetical protein ACQY0O_001639 [Thecaphora frezii]